MSHPRISMSYSHPTVGGFLQWDTLHVLAWCFPDAFLLRQMSMTAIKAPHYTHQFQSLIDGNAETSSLAQKFNFTRNCPESRKLTCHTATLRRVPYISHSQKATSSLSRPFSGWDCMKQLRCDLPLCSAQMWKTVPQLKGHWPDNWERQAVQDFKPGIWQNCIFDFSFKCWNKTFQDVTATSTRKQTGIFLLYLPKPTDLL